MFNRIVVLVDGSDASRYAIDVGLTAAREDIAELLFCSTVDPGLDDNGIGRSVMSDLAAELGRRALDEALAHAREAGFPHVAGRVLPDQAAHGVVAFARSQAAGLIILGVSPRAPMLRPFMQTVVEKVLRETTIPLCAVRSPHSGTLHRRIFVPVVDDELSHIGIAYAIQVARGFRSRLLFCTVTGDGGEPQALHALQQAQDAATAAGIACDVVLLPEGGIAQAIVRNAQFRACDSIVIASHAREGWPRIIEGSVTEAVFYLSEIPVVIVRTPFATTTVSAAG